MLARYALRSYTSSSSKHTLISFCFLTLSVLSTSLACCCPKDYFAFSQLFVRFVFNKLDIVCNFNKISLTSVKRLSGERNMETKMQCILVNKELGQRLVVYCRSNSFAGSVATLIFCTLTILLLESGYLEGNEVEAFFYELAKSLLKKVSL